MELGLFLIGVVLVLVIVAAVRTKRGPRTSTRPRNGTTSHEEAKALGSHLDRGPW